MQGVEGLKERLLRLEREAPFEEGHRENAALIERIRAIHQKSRGTYGYLRVHAELRALGVRCKRKRVGRLMRKDGLEGCMRGGRRKHTTRQDPLAIAAPDLVERNFAAPTLNRIWTADITYVRARMKAFCIWPSSWTSTAGRWLVGLWQAICALNW
jgi:transposase InsO family protein